MEQFPDHTNENEQPAIRTAEDTIPAVHSDALRAYLQVPDIPEPGPDLLDRFHDAYLGTYESMDALVAVARSDFAESAAAEGIDLHALDSDLLKRAFRRAWHIIEDGQRVHLFERTDEL